jgi:hypothetical protein
MSKGLRKRYLVSEGELFLLWAEIEQLRDDENRKAYKARFNTLLKEAHPVKLVVEPKETPACASVQKGGNHGH